MQFLAFEGNMRMKGRVVLSPDHNGVHKYNWEAYKEYLTLDALIGSVNRIKGGGEVEMAQFHDFSTSTDYGLTIFDTL